MISWLLIDIFGARKSSERYWFKRALKDFKKEEKQMAKIKDKRDKSIESK
ncbi:hypothetical protein [Spiroplasma culicicola]|uniref:Uncharacterized protein n=1 Tax=Spiroplasma culicicola AES-1 TaxID=1276246 RepID=W6A7H1_9MOLU|nr:hypothetical protein [Spiroplasma culicicola]AHI52931.1 hypothetical protein SCULI_v1c05900 [Spiroplasma culicicola AES-1]